MMVANIISIGNSKGIRIPKVFLEQLGMRKEVFLRVEENRLVVEPVKKIRKNWAEEAKKIGTQKKQIFLETHNTFDETEWEWK